MTHYFMRDIPLRQMEQMITLPHFKPRGHGVKQSASSVRPKIWNAVIKK